MTAKDRNFLRQFGRNLAAMREGQRLTQRILAERAGISTGYIASIESGRRWPRLIVHYAMANALGIEVDKLFEGVTFEP